MASSIARSRLGEERKAWRKDHPYGFVAKPATNADDSLNLMVWNCLIPGKQDTIWGNALYPLIIEFSEEYPTKAPVCTLILLADEAHRLTSAGRFPAGFFHVNVFDTGHICLSLLTQAWKPSITIKQLVIGIQDLLDTPNTASPASIAAAKLYTNQRAEYDRLVKSQAQKYKEI